MLFYARLLPFSRHFLWNYTIKHALARISEHTNAKLDVLLCILRALADHTCNCVLNSTREYILKLYGVIWGFPALSICNAVLGINFSIQGQVDTV